jgi:hypothetical protein
MKTIKDMYYVALGNVLDLIEKSDTYKAFVDFAETDDEANIYARRSLKYKAMYIVEFDREMDRLMEGSI